MPRKPKTNQPQTPNKVQGRDFFQTPNYAIDLLIPYIPKKIDWIWEPAAGERKISNVLVRIGYKIFSTDLADLNSPFNFLTDKLTLTSGNWSIITNPPFSLKRKFWERCMEYNLPCALLIPADYSGWIIKAIQNGAEKIIPTRRVDYITPTGLSGATGHTSYYHSMWLTWKFNLGKTETFVELTKEMKENI